MNHHSPLLSDVIRSLRRVPPGSKLSAITTQISLSLPCTVKSHAMLSQSNDLSTMPASPGANPVYLSTPYQGCRDKQLSWEVSLREPELAGIDDEKRILFPDHLRTQCTIFNRDSRMVWTENTAYNSLCDRTCGARSRQCFAERKWICCQCGDSNLFWA